MAAVKIDPCEVEAMVAWRARLVHPARHRRGLDARRKSWKNCWAHATPHCCGSGSTMPLPRRQ